MTLIKNTLFFIFILFYTFSAYSEQTVEEIIKERQSIFSKNDSIFIGKNKKLNDKIVKKKTGKIVKMWVQIRSCWRKFSQKTPVQFESCRS